MRQAQKYKHTHASHIYVFTKWPLVFGWWHCERSVCLVGEPFIASPSWPIFFIISKILFILSSHSEMKIHLKFTLNFKHRPMMNIRHVICLSRISTIQRPHYQERTLALPINRILYKNIPFSRSHYLIVLKLEYSYCSLSFFFRWTFGAWYLEHGGHQTSSSNHKSLVNKITIPIHIVSVWVLSFIWKCVYFHTIIIYCFYYYHSRQKRKSNKEMENTKFYFYLVVNHRTAKRKRTEI